MSSSTTEEGVPPLVEEEGGDGGGPPAGAPRLEALFAKTLAEGWLKQQVCDGMMRGMVESVRSGKKTEDECLAEATTKLEGMRKGGEAKKQKKAKQQQQQQQQHKQQQKGKPDGAKQAAQNQSQSPKQMKKQKLKRRPAQQILQQLGPESPPAAQLEAAKHIGAMCFQIRGQEKREYQDALTPALQRLTEMARSDVEERAASALHAMYGLCAHHKAHVDMLVEMDIVETIALILQAPNKSLGLQTNGCLVLNTVATNCFEAHDKIVEFGALPCLISSLILPKPAPVSATTVVATSRLVESLSATVKESLSGCGEDEQLLVIVRGLPGSGKTHLARGIAAYLEKGLICSADSYFTQEDENGQLVYAFDNTKMKDAHAHCQMQYDEALALGSPVIIVDNTNLKLKDYANYLAKAAGYKPLVFQLESRSDRDVDLYCSRCVHSVPLGQIKTMAKSYQADPAAILVEPWGMEGADTGSDVVASKAVGTGSSTVDNTSLRLDTAVIDFPSPRDESAGAQTPRRGQRVKPLRYSTVKILNAMSYNKEMRSTLIEAGAVDALNARLLELTGQNQSAGRQFDHMAIVCTDEYLWTLRASIKLVGQDEVSLISEELQARGIRWLLSALKNALDGKGFPQEYSTPATPSKYAQDIACLAISDANAKLLTDLGAFELMRRTMLAEWSEQTAINMSSDPLLHAHALYHATATLSMLSFSGLGRDGQSTRQQIQDNEELLKVLNQLAQEQSEGVITPRDGDEQQHSKAYMETMRHTRKQAKVLLLNLKHHSEALEVLAEADESDDEHTGVSDRHIMLSYCWGKADSNGVYPTQQLVLRIREGLQQRGYKVWLDVDDLCGSTLNAMANAVEKADIVCIVMTKAYKESAPCRMEADYSYQLNGANGVPKIIPLKAEQFKPDGWVCPALLPPRPQLPSSPPPSPSSAPVLPG
jgi:tRNA A37 threonylcarbamoyladenosine biosynthesis protein TsaE